MPSGPDLAGRLRPLLKGDEAGAGRGMFLFPREKAGLQTGERASVPEEAQRFFSPP